MDTFREGVKVIKEEFIDSILEYLRTDIFANKNVKSSMAAYSKVFELANRGKENSPKLYDYYKSIIKDYTLKCAILKIKSKKGRELLQEFFSQWEKTTILIYWMKKAFMFLDRFFLQEKDGPKITLSQTGLNIFKESVFEACSKLIVKTIFEEIQCEREGDYIDWGRIQKILHCYKCVGLTDANIEKTSAKSGELGWIGTSNNEYYKSMFEYQFIEQSSKFYQQVANKWFTSLNCPEYLKKAQEHLKGEEDKVDNYLDKETKPLLLDSLTKIVIQNFADRLAEKEGTGCANMFKHKKLDELKLMYSLFARVEDTLSCITRQMKPYIEERGTMLISDKELQKDPIEFITHLLALKQEMDLMLEISFNNSPVFQKTRDIAFQGFMNTSPFVPSYLAIYCDKEFTKGIKGLSEKETEIRINAIIDLFICLNGRDIFIKDYKKYLAKRLLNNTTISDAAEEMMISKLKVECGFHTIVPLTSMFVDMELSKEIMANFKSGKHKGVIKAVQMDMKVLSCGNWPEQQFSPCKIPAELKFCTEKFDEYYQNKHSGRSLKWILKQGNCEVFPLYGKKKYNFIVSVYQATILSLFNRFHTLTYTQVKEETEMQKEELDKQLKFLFNPRMRVLKKEEAKKALCHPAEKISVNLEFASNSLKCHLIPVAGKKQQLKDPAKASLTSQEINRERGQKIDSVIVRIMKVNLCLNK
jgi:hypothetical protein